MTTSDRRNFGSPLIPAPYIDNLLSSSSSHAETSQVNGMKCDPATGRSTAGKSQLNAKDPPAQNPITMYSVCRLHHQPGRWIEHVILTADPALLPPLSRRSPPVPRTGCGKGQRKAPQRPVAPREFHVPVS